MPTTCVLAHRDPAAAGVGFLCFGHFERLRKDLEDIGRIWLMLDGLAVARGSGRRGSGKPGKRMPAPVRLEVLDLADDVKLCVGGWLEVLAEESGRMGSRPTTVPAAARALRINADWLAEHAAAEEIAEELHAIARRMRALIGENPPPPIGLCPDCGEPLRATDGGFPVVCSGCGGTWREGDAGHMARSVMLAWRVGDAAEFAGVTPRTIRLWTSAGYVRKLGRGLVHAGDTLAHAVRLQHRGA